MKGWPTKEITAVADLDAERALCVCAFSITPIRQISMSSGATASTNISNKSKTAIVALIT